MMFVEKNCHQCLRSAACCIGGLRRMLDPNFVDRFSAAIFMSRNVHCIISMFKVRKYVEHNEFLMYSL